MYPLVVEHVVPLRYCPVGHWNVEHHAQPFFSPPHVPGPEATRYWPAKLQVVGQATHTTVVTPEYNVCLTLNSWEQQATSDWHARSVAWLAHARVACWPAGQSGHLWHCVSADVVHTAFWYPKG